MKSKDLDLNLIRAFNKNEEIGAVTLNECYAILDYVGIHGLRDMNDRDVFAVTDMLTSTAHRIGLEVINKRRGENEISFDPGDLGDMKW